MKRDEILAILQAHEPELKAAGILHLRLFGSVARGEGRPDSDIDLAADLDDERVRTLLDLVRLERKLAEVLRTTVDLSVRENLYPRVRKNFEQEALLAF
jgi:uncharacterized protein